MNPEQTTIFPQATPKGKKRNCDQCGKEYTALTDRSRYCSTTCRSRASVIRSVKGQEDTTEKKDGLKAHPTVFNRDAELISFYKDLYNEEKAERKRLQLELEKKEKEMRDNEHKQMLNGLEQKKPDFMDRIAGMPAEILGPLGKLIDKFGNMVIPEGTEATPIAGVEGQLDEAQVHLISWINALPEHAQKSLLSILAAFTHMDETKLVATLTKIQNLLNNGTTLNGSGFGVDQSMYGS